MSDGPTQGGPQNGPTQDGPIQEGATEATRDEQVRGILEQVRQDLSLGHADDEEGLLRQRLAESGIAFDDDELRAWLA